MVLIFAPVGNASNPCAGVNDYDAMRPVVTDQFRNANVTLYSFWQVVEVMTLVWVWIWRNKPRFRKVRPFGMSVMLLLGFSVYDIAAFLAPVYSMPCASIVAFYTVSLAWFGSGVILRAIVLSVETQYATIARGENTLFADEASVAMSNASTQPFSLSFLSTLGFLTRVTLGIARVEDMAIAELVLIKNSYNIMLALCSVPAILCFILLVATVPPYQTCYNCDVFLELPIGFTITLSLYIIVAFRVVYFAFKSAGWDQKGVVIELFSIPMVIGNIAVMVWILIIIDPNNLNFDRKFNWSSLFFVSTAAYWWNCFGYPIYRQFRDDRKSSTFQIVDMKTMCSTNPMVKKDFEDFATKLYVTESLQFLEDVSTYKQFYYDKGENWRISKFKSLVETYIFSGSKMEINISSAMKTKLLRLYETSSTTTITNNNNNNNAKQSVRNIEYYDAFDEAYSEVARMINNGAWTEFLMKRSRKSPTAIATAEE